jgi:anti-sigma-K factor RskA
MRRTAHVGEDLGAYAAGALDEASRQAVDDHTARCSRCREELRRLLEAASELAQACPTVEPRLTLKPRILAALRSSEEYPARPLGNRHVAFQWNKRAFPAWLGVAGWCGLAAACVLFGIHIGELSAANRFAGITASPRVHAASGVAEGGVHAVTPEAMRDAVRLIGESEVWDLRARRRGPRIPCTIIQPHGADHAMLVSDLPVPHGGMIYRVWLIRGGSMHRLAVVRPGHMVQTIIPMRVRSGDVIAFSMEPPRGSPNPSGHFVMEETL